MKEDNLEELGLIADSLDNLIFALKMPIPNELHVESLRQLLPDLHSRLQEVLTKEGVDIE